MKTLLPTIILAAALLPAVAQTSAPADGEGSGFTGKVLETTNAAGYTYVLVDTGTKKSWAATTQFEVKSGDTVTVSPGNDMPGFHSRALNRDFDSVYFTGSITVNNGAVPVAGSTPALPAGHPPIGGAAAPVLPVGHPDISGGSRPGKSSTPIDLAGIKPAAGGKTVQQIVDGKDKLSGKTVTVRGKVMKYNGGIMNKNWLHIQDGSGSADKANNDLTVTTATEAKVGDTVLVTGNLSLNKDFGGGYKYAVILDDAKVIVE